jgi:hypothetical protein
MLQAQHFLILICCFALKNARFGIYIKQCYPQKKKKKNKQQLNNSQHSFDIFISQVSRHTNNTGVTQTDRNQQKQTNKQTNKQTV